MASSQRTVAFLVEQMAAAGAVSATPMFGEYAVYGDGKVVALICDDRLFVKPTATLTTTRTTPSCSTSPPGWTLTA